MQINQEIEAYIGRLSEKIDKSEDEWRGNRFASFENSDSEEDEDDEIENQSYLEKYRGKSGDLKPLGLVLYYKYLRALIVLFFLLTIISIPPICIYFQSQGLSELTSSTSFSKSILFLSVANLPHYRLDTLTEKDLREISFHRNLTIFSDVLCVLIVMVFIVYWKVIETRISNEYTSRSPSPHQYCLKVSKCKGYSQEELKRHFSSFGKVAQISCIYTHKDIMIQLRKVVKLVSLLKNYKPDELKYQETLHKIASHYHDTSDKYINRPRPHIKSCYLVFQRIKTRNRVADLYRYRICPEKLMISKHELMAAEDITCERIVDDKEQVDQEKTLFNKIMPKVRECRYEPLTINWQNCDIGKKDQRGKFMFQGFLLIVMLSMILLALFLLNINSTHVRESIPVPEQESPEELTLQYKELKKIKNDQKIIYTFCASLTYSNFKWDYYELCSDYFQVERNRFVLMLLFALMVALINLLTNRILWALVAFRRYKTLAGRNQFLITSIFCFSLINSAVLLLMVRGNYTGPILRKIVGFVLGFPEALMRVKIYSQFNRQWYMNIGSQLIVNYVVSLIIFTHFHVFLHWIRSLYRKFMARKGNKAIKRPNFNYCTFYALSLKALFFAMLYSNCMPVFYFLCLCAFTVQYYVGKFLLKYFVTQPVFVDNNSIQVAVSLIPYSLILHCVTSILFLNVEEIFPQENSFFNMDQSWLQTNIHKFERGSVYIVLLVIIVLFIWQRRRIEKVLVRFWLGRAQKDFKSQTYLKFSEIRNNPAFLASYKMRDNPKYKILYYALHLFESNMRKILQKKKSLHLIPQHQDDKQYPTASIFVKGQNEEETAKEMEDATVMEATAMEEEESKGSGKEDYQDFEDQIVLSDDDYKPDFDDEPRKGDCKQVKIERNGILREKTNQF